MKKIKLKHIFSALVIIPFLLLGGCKGENTDKTQEELLVEYQRVHQNNVEYEYETTVNYTYDIYDDTLYINTHDFQ